MTTTDLAPRVPPRRWILGALAVAIAGLVSAVIAVDLGTGVAIFALTVGIGVLVTAWARPAILVVIGLGLLYGNVPVVAEARLGVPYAIAAMAVPGLLAGALLHDVVLRRRPLVFPGPAIWLLLYYVALVVATVWSASIETSAAELLVFLSEGLLLYLLIANTIRDRRTLHAALASIVVVAALLGGLSLFQTATSSYDQDFLGFAQYAGEEEDTQLIVDPAEPPPRVAGPIGEQNRYAQILLMVLPLPAVTVLRARRTWVRVSAAVLGAACATGIALTTSRGAGVALVLTLLTMVALREVRIRSLLVVAVAIAVGLALVPQYAARFASASGILGGAEGVDDVDGAVVGRLSSNIGAIRVFLEHPVTGVGPGNYGQFHKAAVADLGLRVIPNREPHNLYPHIAAESGVLGLAAFSGLVVMTLQRLWRTRRRLRERGDPAIAATGLFFGVVAYLWSGLFLHLSYARYFWMLMALAAVAALVDDAEVPTAPSVPS